MTLQFIFTSVFFIFGTAFLANILHFITQEKQLLDLIFNYQKRLEKIGSKSGFINTALYKILGGCFICFSHFVSVISFVVFCCFFVTKGEWFSTLQSFSGIVINALYYLIYVTSSTSLSMIDTKWLFKAEKNNSNTNVQDIEDSEIVSFKQGRNDY